MFLYRTQHASPSFNEKLKVTRKGKTTYVSPELPTCLQEEIGYWRKANHIHAWFVDNVQDGEDDCKKYSVSRDQLAKLYEIVDRVLDASKLVPGKVANGYTWDGDKRVDILEDGQVIEDPAVAIDLLPTRKGLFFGHYDYDQYYVEDLRHTRKILTEALSLPAGYGFIYQSSW